MGKKNKKKAKKQAFISGIIRDGKITKKEARKASKQGISLARIQKAQTKSFKPNNVFSNAKVSREPSRMAPRQFRADETLPARFSNNIAKSYQQAHGGLGTYSPLVIQGAAQKVFDGQTQAPTRQPVTYTTPGGSGPENKPEQSTVDPMLQALMDQNNLLQQRLDNIPDFESIFAQQAEQAAQQRANELAQMQQQQALYMEEMAARQAEQERQRLLTAQTQQANTARAGMAPDFSIGGRSRADQYGTGGFKRRPRFRPATIAQGILPAVAASVPAILNV